MRTDLNTELVTLAVAQALLGITSETRWLRFLPRRLPGAFRYVPQQSGYNKRLRNAMPLLQRAIRIRSRSTPTSGRRDLDRGPHPDRMRPLPRDGQAVGVGRMGRLPLLRKPFRFSWGLRLRPLAG
ncbi:hypothetical protein F4560_008683 [Saccharothrix ecbatanensis]|uniref:Uncharacterized protein n=1 Tax=Saccharothrix ecbatanensis TaxID=1105145 RepID=A0A7W9M666_9PSEU|nr:hypothetical protein [Saccharothrix ecbatanensis]MBB5808915.1 hypothetical protein [Saccharothrix ecbatanensis]